MLLETLARNAALALRLLRRNPTYALTALLTLALGLATTTAIFAVIDTTLLRPLPFPDPGRLVSLNSMLPVLLAIFAVSGLLLALVGVYGVAVRCLARAWHPPGTRLAPEDARHAVRTLVVKM